ncbi:MAG: 2-oxoglutarate dehydrogenase complex dihydrolipoyllysine-residue succinyltransferase [Sphingomonadales bacterium]
MTTRIEVPALGESITEAIIGKWFKNVGDAVATDEPVLEIETDKITVEVNAPAAGALAEITAREGDTVEVGALLGLIDGAARVTAAPARNVAAPAAASRPEAAPAAAAREVVVPSLGESISEAIIGRWFKAVGDAVKADELLAELETDKVTLEVFASSSGALAEIRAQEGQTVSVGAVIGVIDEAAAGTSPAPAPAAPVVSAAPVVQPAQPEPAAPMSPSVRRLVGEHGLDAARIPASGKGGRLTKGDVLAALGGQTAEVPAPAPTPAPAVARADDPREERVRMSPLRRRIAQRLKEAQNTAAMLTTFNEVDMSALMETRAQYKEAFEKRHGVRLGFMSFFVRACVTALKEIPAVNGEVDGDDIVYKNHYDIGVAVSAPQGLVVPVVRDADAMNFADIEGTITDLGIRARDGKLAIDELQGGTFTISNGGVFGSLMSTPILNPPQSAILGMHKIQKRPVAIGDQVVVRPMMYLALSYDHRIIDGREAVTFLVRVKECLEDPTRLLLDL